MNYKNRSMVGFTLLELLIVVIILGILSALAIPSYTQHIEKGDLAEAKTTLVVMNQEIVTSKLERLIDNKDIPKDTIQQKYINTKLSNGSNVKQKFDVNIVCQNDDSCNHDYYLYAKPKLSGRHKGLWMNDLGESYLCTNVDVSTLSDPKKNTAQCKDDV